MRLTSPTLLLLAAAACASSQSAAIGPGPVTRWQRNALSQHCGLRGLLARDVRDAWGTPDSILPADEALATWVYRHGAVRLRLTFLVETLDSWEVVGPVSARLWQTEPAWSMNQRKGFPQRVSAYLTIHSSLPLTEVYALYRACPQPGMSEAEIIASWGEPSDRRLEASGHHLVLRYGFGVEGQHDRLVFEGDSLVAFSAGGPTF